MWYVADNHNYMCHVCAKGCLDLNLNEVVIDKISNFHKIAPNFTYSQKSYFLKYCWKKIDKLGFYPVNFMAGKCKESTFSFLPVVSD